ncbi:ribosome biogenesis protein Nop53/GLTSCR2 [Chiua virens]|nr:ribosome biogenesis protein Nop53/GLTSCR2 [Chiua virens]
MTSTTSPTSSNTSSKVVRKKTRSAVGAPSQLLQSSRKGKRAWRKNIDIQPVEEGLESLRAEERVVGSILQKQTNDQLFVVDTKGDEQGAKCQFFPEHLQDHQSYPSSKIVASVLEIRIDVHKNYFTTVCRSCCPVAPNEIVWSKISRADKERLLRIAKRPRKGHFNAIMDPTEFGAGSAAIDVSHAVKHSGGHDLWDVPTVEEIIPDGLETIQNRSIKKPELGHPRDVIVVPAVSAPHPGASYNPPVQAHQELLMEAYKVEQQRQEEADRLQDAKKKIEQARASAAIDCLGGCSRRHGH